MASSIIFTNVVDLIKFLNRDDIVVAKMEIVNGISVGEKVGKVVYFNKKDWERV